MDVLVLSVSGFDDLNLTINTDMATVVKAMAQPDSGLEIRDRMWLKITIPNAFIGEQIVQCSVSQFLCTSHIVAYISFMSYFGESFLCLNQAENGYTNVNQEKVNVSIVL